MWLIMMFPTSATMWHIMLRHICMLLCSSLVLRVVCQSMPFEAHEATIMTIHDALLTGSNTCRDVVSAFLSRVESYNSQINAIISLNPVALQIADQLDERLKQGNMTGLLFCVPILLKDNYDMVGLPTTAGCVALRDSFPTKDASTVSALKNAGAIILGKTNLHEFALEGLSVSSLGGQTINPYDFTRTPGGSSGGSGAAIAASFAVLGTGTDTVNSLRNPASANSLYSFRPTRGLISRAGIVLVSSWQDTAGAMGRSLVDIVVALKVMSSVGIDKADNATSIAQPIHKPAIDMDKDSIYRPSPSLNGKRIGILHPFFNHTSTNETSPVNILMQNVLTHLSIQNASLINLNSADDQKTYNPSALLQLDLQQFEYRQLLTAYLSSAELTGPHPQTMPQLYLNTSDYLVIPKQYNYIHTALNSSTSSPLYHQRITKVNDLTATLDATFSQNTLDAIIYPQQRNLVVPLGSPTQSNRNGILAALTGSPVITIPIGFSNASATAPIGIPVGMEILGLPWSEDSLLDIARGLDDILQARRPPVLPDPGPAFDLTKTYESVPVIQPSGIGNVDLTSYPTGVF